MVSCGVVLWGGVRVGKVGEFVVGLVGFGVSFFGDRVVVKGLDYLRVGDCFYSGWLSWGG